MDEPSKKHPDPDVPPLTNIYTNVANKSSAIQRWMPILEDLASGCISILELGAKKSTVTWALLHGMCIRAPPLTKALKLYILNDVQPFNVNDLLRLTESYGVLLEFYWQDDLTLDLTRHVDMVVIDTIRMYAHLRLELQKFSRLARRYIVILNTTKYDTRGEFFQDQKQTRRVCSMYGYAEEDVDRGMMPAIQEFLDASSTEWSVDTVDHQENGIVVLVKN